MKLHGIIFPTMLTVFVMVTLPSDAQTDIESSPNPTESTKSQSEYTKKTEYCPVPQKLSRTGFDTTIVPKMSPLRDIRLGPPEDGVDYSHFMANMMRRVRICWSPPKGCESKEVQVTFTTEKNGVISKVHLKKSSGVKIADEAAMKAIEQAAPFLFLPQETPGSVDIQFTFDDKFYKGESTH